MCAFKLGFKYPYGFYVPLFCVWGGVGAMAAVLEHVMLLTASPIAAERELFMVLQHHQKEADTTQRS